MDRDTIDFMRDIATGIRKEFADLLDMYLEANPLANPRHPTLTLAKQIMHRTSHVIDKACDEAESKQ